MIAVQFFKLKTYLVAFFIILGLPGIVNAIIWFLFPPSSIGAGILWLTGEFAAWMTILLLIPKLWGSDLQKFLRFDTLKILKTFEQSTDRTLYGIRDTLPVVGINIRREETNIILELLHNGKHVLITGESGSGKSGIAASLAKDAKQRGIPVLFLDTLQYSRMVRNIPDLGHFVNTDTSLPSLPACIEQVSKQVGSCLLIMDQLDSTIGTPASQASIELLAKASLYEGVQVVAVGCIGNQPEFKPILNLEFVEVTSEPIDRQVIDKILAEIGITSPSQIIRAITDNLFYLSIILEFTSRSDFSEINSEILLLESYICKLEATEGGAFVQAALEIAKDKMEAGEVDFQLPRAKDPIVNRLIQRGILIPLLNGKYYRFRHEQLHYFLFVKQVIEQRGDWGTILSNSRIPKKDKISVFALKYFHACQHPGMKTFLDMVFGSSDKLTFYDKASLLDEIVTWPDVEPYVSNLSSILDAIRTEPLSRYFFNQLATSKNPSWLAILRAEGFYNSPPPAFKTEDGLYHFYWPALSYLDAIASELPSEIVEIAKNIQLENGNAVSFLVGSFAKISADFAPQILPIIVRWLNLGLPVNEELIALIQHWAKSEQWESVLTLSDIILTPEEEPAPEALRQNPYFSPRAKFREFNYYLIEQFLKLNLPEYLENHGSEFLSILEQKIIQALSIEYQLEQERQSSYWRTSIESSSQILEDRCKDLLLDAALKAVQILLSQKHPNAIPTIDRYLVHPYSIFGRLAIHIIRGNQSLWPRYLDDLYSDSKYWEDLSYYHEYWLLTQQTFLALAPEKQKAYLDRIVANISRSKDEAEKDLLTRERRWVYRRLWAIKDDLPGTDIFPIFEELRKEFGDPKPPEKFAFLAYGSEIRFGDISTKSSDELIQLSPDEVLMELKKPYQSRYVSFDDPTREGLATELGRAIKDNPVQFVSIAPQLVDEQIHPLYVAHAIRGFRDAWKEKKAFDWEPVLSLCHKVSQTREELSPDGSPIDLRPNYWGETYSNARAAVVELVEIAVANDDNAIPHKYLIDVRTILLRSVDDYNPSPEYEADWGTRESQGYLNLSLNVVRGKALIALIHYALHLARIVDKDEAARDLLPPGARIEPEVRQKLTEKLDKNLDPSKAVHINFGLYLPNLNYLDSEWVMTHLGDIFPLAPEKIEYWYAAWEGYMSRNDFYGALYPNLGKYYDYAVELLEKGDKLKPGFKDSTPILAAHFAMLYGHGEESLDGEDSLIARFLNAASDAQIAWFVQMLSPGRAGEQLTATSDGWQRRRTFWCQRYDHIRASEQLEDHLHELSAYLWWVPHIPEPLAPFYEMIETSALVAENFLLVKLVEHLTEQISANLRFVVTLYEKLYQKQGHAYYWVADRKDVPVILETAICSDDPIAKESAVRIINLYGERGNESYRPLLEKV